MDKELRILILEDVSADAELMTFELSEAGIQFMPRFAVDKRSFLNELDEFVPDIILSDYSLPSFDGLSALRITLEKCPDVPFIFVSGALGEEKAIDLLKEGATDYVLKNRLIRLGPAVLRALNEVAERRERKKVEDALKESREMLYITLESITDAFFTLDRHWHFTYLNKDAEHIWKKKREDLVGQMIWQVSPDAVSNIIEEEFRRAMENKIPVSFEAYLSPLSIWVNARVYPTPDGLAIYFQDVSDRVETERKLLESNEQLRHLTSELINAEDRERRQIAVDLHDNIGQTLAVTKMKLDSIHERAQNSGLEEPLKEITDLITQSIQQTRTLMTELSPTVLYELGFIAGMEYLTEQIRMQYGLQVVLVNHLKIKQIEQEVQLLLFRATRELLLNVVKHAKVTKAFVTLQKIGENIRISVSDAGSGFDLAGINQHSNGTGGFGLFSIKERLQYLGGLCKIETGIGNGTRVTLTVPATGRKKEG